MFSIGLYTGKQVHSSRPDVERGTNETTLQKIVQWIQAVDVATSHSVTVTVGFLRCLALYMHS